MAKRNGKESEENMASLNNLADAATAAAAALTEVKAILTNTGLSVTATDGFVDSQGIASIEDLGVVLPSDMGEMIRMHNDALSRNDKQRITGLVISQRMEALVTQIRYRKFVGGNLTQQHWMYTSQMTKAVDEMKSLKKARAGETEPTEFVVLTDKDKLDSDFETIESGIKSVLSKIASAHEIDIGIDYLLHPAGSIAPAGSSDIERRCYAAANKTGLATDEDNKKFWEMLKQWGVDLPAWPTLKRFEKKQDGRAAFIAMREVYEGEDYKQKRLAREKRVLQETGEGSLQYLGETTGIRFSDYASKLLIPMEFIHEVRGGWPEEARIERLVSGFGQEPRQHPSIQIGIEKVLDEKTTWTYHRAVSYLSNKVASAYADTLAQKNARESTRHVKEASQQDDYAGRGRGTMGRGHFGHRGRGYFRGRGGFAGRGSGRGGGRGNSNPVLDGSKEVESIHGIDTSDSCITEGMIDWSSPAVRDYCKRRRHFLRTGNTKFGSDNGNTTRNANVSQVQMSNMIAEAVAAAMKGPKEEGIKQEGTSTKKSNGEKGGHMGNGMGKGAHKK